MFCLNTIFEAERVPLDLRFNLRRAIYVRTVGDMAVGPYGMLPGWRAGGVEQALLRHQHKGFVRELAPDRIAFGGGNLVKRAAQVNRPGAGALCRRPGDWPIQREVHFAHAGTVAVAFQRATITAWQLIPGDAQQLSGRYV